MQTLVVFFFELCLLRRRPQDLPASDSLLGLVVVVSVLAGVLMSVSAGASVGAGLWQSLLDLAFLLVLLGLALRLTDRSSRLRQSATALIGTDTLIGVFAALPLSFATRGGGDDALLFAAFMLLGLIVWSVLVTAHILRHIFDITLGQAALVALSYDFLAYALIGGLFQSGPQ